MIDGEKIDRLLRLIIQNQLEIMYQVATSRNPMEPIRDQMARAKKLLDEEAPDG